MIRRLLPALLAGALLPSPLPAQFTPLTVPRGLVGMELHSRLESWDRVFRDGTREAAGSEYGRYPIGAASFPSLAAADVRLARLTGLTSEILNAGRFRAAQLNTVGEIGLGLQAGITSRFTLSGFVPIRRIRVQTVAAYDSTDANSGLNPADPALGNAGDLAATLAFFLQFDAAIEAMSDGLANGTWSGNPNTESLATMTLADAQAMRDDLYALLVDSETHAAFMPLAASPAGVILRARLEELQDRIGNGLSIPGFTRPLILPTSELTTADWERFITEGDGPVAGSLAAPTYMSLGDIEIGGAYLLMEGRGGGPGRTIVRTAIKGTVRLRTSRLGNPSSFFDPGTGDRQPDAELSLVSDLYRGRGALRLMGWYTRQLPGNQQRRIGPPDQPIRYLNTLAALRKDPGDVFGIGIYPAYRFTSTLALLAGAQWWTKGEDRYEYADGQPPLTGLDPQVLAEDSAARALTLRAGLTFSKPGARGSALPLDASVTWERTVSASGGVVPVSESVSAMLRIYGRFW